MPGISLDLVQTVAIGAFNPHIVRPDWMIRQKLCKAEEFGGVEFLPTGDDEDEVFRFGRQEWQVDYTRLSVSVRKPGSPAVDDTGLAVAGVIRLLPHTPVHTVGHNFHFSCTTTEWGGKPLPQLGPNVGPALDGREPTQTSWSGTYERGDGVWTEVTADVSRTHDIVVLLFNHDRAVEPEDHETALHAAGRLSEDWAFTVRLLNDLFRIEWAS